MRWSALTLRDRLSYGIDKLVRQVGQRAASGEFLTDHGHVRVSRVASRPTGADECGTTDRERRLASVWRSSSLKVISISLVSIISSPPRQPMSQGYVHAESVFVNS